MEDLATEFNGLLAHHLECGQYFDIEVIAAKNAKRFHISLAKEKLNKHPQAEIGLHVDVNFDFSEISAKTQMDEVVVERSGRFILKDEIKITLHMLESSFQISVNGEHKLQIYYRVALEHLKAIQIGGDVKIIKRVDHRQIYPSLWPPSSYVHYFPTPLAFSNDIPIRFKPGHLMVITGRCYGQATGDFFINLKHGHNETQVMHLNVMFQHRRVSRYSCIPSQEMFFGHNYVDHESDGGFPFDFNKSFKIGIACKDKEFVIAVNGQYFCSYTYRDPENIHRNGVAARPYTSVLSNMVGMKVFQREGTGVKFTEVDHIQLDNPECINFEKYTRSDCECREMSPCSKLSDVGAN